MTEYLEITIDLTGKGEEEVLPALLAEMDFEGFSEEEGRVRGYIEAEKFSPQAFEGLIAPVRHLVSTWRSKHIPWKNWNEEWEKNYSAVEISGDCIVRAPFHQPGRGVKYDLVISPGMSFGTAHHETTRLMMLRMLERDWSGKKVLDLGCGTGILAVLAEKLGAKSILAVDIDPLACTNAEENFELNDCGQVRVREMECRQIRQSGFDIIMANINLNVLLDDLAAMSSRITGGGMLMLSGFYSDDLLRLDKVAHQTGLVRIEQETLNDWTVAVYRKAH